MAILGIGIERDGAVEGEVAKRDLVDLEVRGGNVLETCDAELVFERRDLCAHDDQSGLQQIGSPRQHWLLARPDEMRGKLFRHRRTRISGCGLIPAVDIDIFSVSHLQSSPASGAQVDAEPIRRSSRPSFCI